VSSRGGAPTLLIDRTGTEQGLKFPGSAGPGRLLYFAQETNASNSALRLLRLDDPAHPVTIVNTEASGVYDSGTLFYKRRGLWIGQAFDPQSGRLTGDGVPVPLDSSIPSANIGSPNLQAAGGHVATQNVAELLQATWVSRTGSVLNARGAASQGSAISPDGRHAAVSRLDAASAASL
jgi:hypothetical protein